MERKAVLVGDPPSKGGAVLPTGLTQATVKGVPYATIGGPVHCASCKSIGRIAKAGGPYRMQMYGFETALEGDIVLCKCQIPPTLIAKTVGSGSPHVSVDDRIESLGPVPASRSYTADFVNAVTTNPLTTFPTPPSERGVRFMLLDANSRPLVEVFYSVQLPTGKIVHGVSAERGLTERYVCEQAAAIAVYLGHVGFKLPAALFTCPTTTDLDSVVVVQADRLAKPWAISNKGIQFMAVLESGVENGKNWANQTVVGGMILKVYDDGYGIPTVGLGHKVIAVDGLKIGDDITEKQAQVFAKKDLADVEGVIHRLVRVALHQHEYDALVSILFNTGLYRGKHDSGTETRAQRVAAMVNTGAYKAASESLRTFISERVPGRRKNEAKLFSEGTYDAAH